ncbi:hypothetical protein [Bacillus sp. V59.32b]|uniref:hypothetical protein n=1 Tax=Bacillus sp. V59.32b TaxID=1758642 RepID=UPI000E3D5357|nr:hypothetical protein [Bacillus sp. V59.32b]RFU67440.1 hypothetical protein D0463_07520 [Bacillus sp. V59.32b]
MESIVKRLTARTKKYFFLLLSVPIILGALGWLLPAGKDLSGPPSEAEISLGSYENLDFNDQKQVIVLLSNLPFYQEHLPDVWRDHGEDILKDLRVTSVSEQNIKISYSNHPQTESARVVNKIADAFMELDKKNFEQKQTIIKESIDALKNEEVGPEAKVDQQRFLYELQTAGLTIKPAVLLKSPETEAQQNVAPSSKKRAVLGVLIGLTLALLWIVIPELVRAQPKK